MSDKSYIIINLNKAESAETRQERIKEQLRWAIFGALLFFLLAVNVRVWIISYGYDNILDKKQTEISRLKDEINKLQSEIVSSIISNVVIFEFLKFCFWDCTEFRGLQ